MVREAGMTPIVPESGYFMMAGFKVDFLKIIKMNFTLNEKINTCKMSCVLLNEFAYN